jgi:nicotinate-nucleotide adenylyltransferase
MRVGLLGGSFNPAHVGHCRISAIALNRLGLDAVWWLVSPQNPLKPVAGMPRMEERAAAARTMARDPRITVSMIEAQLGTSFTADTLRALHQRFGAMRFVWLMGADNLSQIPRWRHWRGIFENTPVAVFARPSYSFRAIAGRAASVFAAARQPADGAARLADCVPPAWVFLWDAHEASSATALRAGTR